MALEVVQFSEQELHDEITGINWLAPFVPSQCNPTSVYTCTYPNKCGIYP